MDHLRRGLALGSGPDEKVASDFTSVPDPSARRICGSAWDFFSSLKFGGVSGMLYLVHYNSIAKTINMGGTAIGTGLNAVPGFAKLCAANLAKLTGEAFVSATDLVEATPDTGAYVSYSMRHSIRRTCSCLISLFDTL